MLPDFFESMVLNIMGGIYYHQGILDLALKSTILSISTCRKGQEENQIRNSSLKYISLDTLSPIYWAMNEPQKAIQTVQEAIDLQKYRSVDSERYGLPESYAKLIQFQLGIGETEKANEIYNKLKDIKSQVTSPHVSTYTKLPQALIMKYSTRGSNKYKALELLKEIIENTNLNSFGIHYVYELMDLLYQEFEHYGETEVLDEIKYFNQKMFDWAENNNSVSVKVEAQILEGKFELINGNYDIAHEIFQDLMSLCEEKGYHGLREKANQELSRAIEELDTWEDLIRHAATLKDRVKQAKIKDYLDYALRVSI